MNDIKSNEYIEELLNDIEKVFSANNSIKMVAVDVDRIEHIYQNQNEFSTPFTVAVYGDVIVENVDDISGAAKVVVDTSQEIEDKYNDVYLELLGFTNKEYIDHGHDNRRSKVVFDRRI